VIFKRFCAQIPANFTDAGPNAVADGLDDRVTGGHASNRPVAPLGRCVFEAGSGPYLVRKGLIWIRSLAGINP
jgi:hypothetical protein